MSGLAAIHEGTGISETTLSVMTETLVHRGPDGLELWIAPHRRVGLGHARFNVSAVNREPSPSPNARIHAIVDGDFCGRDHAWRRLSSADVLVQLYAEFGTACLQRLRGEFAFVLWDERNQSLFAGRDRFGIKPLCYAQSGGTLFVASEAKAILAAGWPAHWDDDYFFRRVCSIGNPGRTMFEGISEVPASHYLAWRAGQLQITRYWNVDYPRIADREALDCEHSIERLREALNEAVLVRLPVDETVGVSLSGGIDSSCILGIVAEQTSNVAAFTICFPESQAGNEEDRARESSERLGVALHRFETSRNAEADNLSDAIYHWEDFPQNPVIVSKFLLSRFVRRSGVRFAFDGEGADTFFAGPDPFHYAQVDPDIGLWQTIVSAPSGRTELAGLALAERTLGYVPSDLRTSAATAQRFSPFWSDEYADRFVSRDPIWDQLALCDVEQIAGREGTAVSQYLHVNGQWTVTQPPLGERSQMAHSVESREPFMDHRLFEVIRSIPASLRSRNGIKKWALREAARPYVTEAAYAAPKQAFPFGKPLHFTQGRLRTLLEDTLRGPTLATLPFFDRRRVLDLLETLTTTAPTPKELNRLLFVVLCACLLQERFHVH